MDIQTREQLKKLQIAKIDQDFNIRRFTPPKTDIYNEELGEKLLKIFISLGNSSQKGEE